MHSEEALRKTRSFTHPVRRDAGEEKDPWYLFFPFSDSHRLRCTVRVSLERKGREDISCSYEWESTKLDWWLASNLEQIELNEVAFRVKLVSWRSRNVVLNAGREVPEIKYHWVRPGSEKTDGLSCSSRLFHLISTPSTKDFLRKIQRNFMLLVVIPIMLIFIACLICYFFPLESTGA